MGRLAAVQDPTGITAYAYDAASRLAAMSYTVAVAGQTLEYTCYGDGARQTLKNPDGSLVTYTYDLRGS